MAFKLKDAGGVLQTITSLKVLDGATLRRCIRMKVMDSDDVTLRTVATFVQPLTLAASPSSQFSSGPNDSLISAPITATPTGGLGPYTYGWAVISGTATINSPTSATTDVTSGTLVEEAATDVEIRCTCTDSTGATATADALIQFFFDNPSI